MYLDNAEITRNRTRDDKAEPARTHPAAIAAAAAAAHAEFGFL